MIESLNLLFAVSFYGNGIVMIVKVNRIFLFITEDQWGKVSILEER